MDDERPPDPNSLEVPTDSERAAARRAELYAVHKARGTLGVYYYLYPDERPLRLLRLIERESEGRER